MISAACVLATLCCLAPQGTDIQPMLDGLPPGATVTIPSGSYAPAVVKQPLTLIGADPAPVFDSLTLAGSGGRVVLVNVRTSADLTGQGFGEVRMHEVEVGAAKLKVDGATYVELSRISFAPNPAGAVEAPNASVMLLDSTVGSLAGARVYHANSGIGAVSATDFERALPNDLSLSAPPRLGGFVVLSWSVPGPAAILFGRLSTQEPKRVPRASGGLWHLVGAKFASIRIFSPGSMTLQVPPDQVLVGAHCAFQAMSITPFRFFSRPVVAVLR